MRSLERVSRQRVVEEVCVAVLFFLVLMAIIFPVTISGIVIGGVLATLIAICLTLALRNALDWIMTPFGFILSMGVSGAGVGFLCALLLYYLGWPWQW